MNDTNEIWQRLNADFSAYLLGVQREGTRQIEAEARRVRAEADRVTQDKPMSRKGDRNV